MGLKAENITVGYYQDIFVLHAISVQAQDDMITCIIGPNGAGKSTLLKTIYGFLKPQEGKIFYNGEEITGIKPFEMLNVGISYIMQEGGILPHLNVEEYLELGGWTFRKNRKRVNETIKAIYQRYPVLQKRSKVRVGKLSGGEQKMIELGKALMSDPTSILFDEPTAGLAPKIAQEICNEIGKLRNEGKTIILVEQNVKRALSLSDFAYVLELGKIKLHGPAEEIDLKQTVVPWVKE